MLETYLETICIYFEIVHRNELDLIIFLLITLRRASSSAILFVDSQEILVHYSFVYHRSQIYVLGSVKYRHPDQASEGAPQQQIRETYESILDRLIPREILMTIIHVICVM